jgi:murein DD-endopeptidase MepM/ murein hydrolase activator NlpD
MWPVAAPMTSGFGMRVHPLSGGARLHAGIDLGAPAGTPIRAAAGGTVVVAGVMGGYGTTVDIRHADGTTTRYAHQSRLLVRSGQQVAAGQVIGLVGSTGASTGPHLHFEVRTPAGPVDPRTWLPG